jgi:peptidyl-prolyl cis-trans isomerase SurA
MASFLINRLHGSQSNRMIPSGLRCLLCTALLCLGLSASLFGQAEVDGVAAVVNDRVITFSQVRKEVDPIEAQYREVYNGVTLVDKIREARLSALKALIERELIIQDFKSKGAFIPDNFIEEKVQKIVQTQYDGDRSALIKTLQANGISMANFREELRNQTIVGFMRNKNVQSAVLVSPYKIEQYYQDNVRQFVQPDQAKIRVIYMKKSVLKEERTNDKGVVEQFDPKESQIEEILQKVETGSDFAGLAKAYSEGPQRTNGGDMGWVNDSTLRRELAKVVFKLRPGEISKVIEVGDGYYIVMVEEVRKATVIPLADVRKQIEDTLLQEERQRLQQEWLNGLRTKAFIKMFF